MAGGSPTTSPPPASRPRKIAEGKVYHYPLVPGRYRWPLTTAAVALLLLTAVVLTYIEQGRDPLWKEPPLWTLPRIAQSIALLAAAVAGFLALMHRRRAPAVATLRPPLALLVGWACGAVFAAGVLYNLWYDPWAYNLVSREDSVSEWLSFFALAVAAGGYAMLTLRRRSNANPSRYGALVLAVVCTLVALEEISWGQRVFHFSTPQPLARLNAQAEFNLHNMLTELSEQVYYAGGFAWLILLPWLRHANAPLVHHLSRRLPIPPRWTIYLAAPAAAFNYAMWSTVTGQLAFFLTVLVLVWSLRRTIGRERRLAAATLALCFAIQLAMLILGHRMIHYWAGTEIKETFLALGLAAAALGSHTLITRPTVPQSRTTPVTPDRLAA